MEQFGLQSGSFMLGIMNKLEYVCILKAENTASDLRKKVPQRDLSKRKLEDLYEDDEDPENPPFSAWHDS